MAIPSKSPFEELVESTAAPTAFPTTYLQPSRLIGGVYQNPVPTEVTPPGMMLKILRKALTVRAERAPRKQLGPFRTDAAVYRQAPTTGLRVTWLGHSTVLLEMDGATILTDPVWGLRSSPFSWLGPKRFYPPPLALGELPRIDAVLLSHDHYDHLDAGTVRALAGRVPLFVCSMGMGAQLARWGVAWEKIRELDWTESLTLADASAALTITALPARHFSGRGTKRNRTLWSSFVLKTAEHSVYFGADTGYYPGFAELGAAYGPFDLTMLEIGASDPLWPQIHLGPDDAMRAYQEMRGELGGGVLLPIHWGLFNLAFHAWYEPVERLMTLAGEAGAGLLLPAPGAPVEPGAAADDAKRWWAPFKS